jgi:hypothetical protein
MEDNDLLTTPCSRSGGGKIPGSVWMPE